MNNNSTSYGMYVPLHINGECMSHYFYKRCLSTYVPLTPTFINGALAHTSPLPLLL